MSLIESQKHAKIKPILLSQIMDKPNDDTYIITATQRLSRFLLEKYEKQQLEQGKQAWKTPHILSWSTWLQQLWLNQASGLLLHTHQERLLWQKVILEDENTHVLNPKALAKQAMAAWEILADYHIDPNCLQDAGEEHQALLRWAGQVEHEIETLQNDHVYYQQHQLLAQLCKKNSFAAPSTIILVGFDSFSPAQHQFFNHLQANQHHIYQSSAEDTPAQIQLSSFSDDEEELRQTCQHIRVYVEKHPEHSLGILIPDLEQRLAQVKRIFSEELTPALSLHKQYAEQGEYFNISMGSPLAKQPMIQSIFSILSLTSQQYLSYQSVSQLLLNPYIMGFEQEAVPRAQFDAQLLRHNHEQLTRSQLLQLSQSSQSSELDLQQWSAFVEMLEVQVSNKVFAGKKALSTWLLLAEEVLKQCFWHEQAVSSDELAQVQNWRDLIHNMSKLDDFCPVLTWAEARARLQEYAFEHPFRPAPGHANIQVMGVLEAAGLRFDHAFILGMDDQTWPPAAKPHPLIPHHIQVLHQTPHANHEREWVFAQSVWQHLIHVAPTLNISYAKSKAHQEVQASSMLDVIAAHTPAQSYASSRYAYTLQQHQADMKDINDTALAVSSAEKIRGGTSILASQSACAFQAFAQHRLQLQGIETPTLGLNPAEQGSLLHKALELFWQAASNHANLSKWIDSQSLHQHIEQSIEQAWSSLKGTVTPMIKGLEKQRLQTLIHRWLMLESERIAFKVLETEGKRDVSFGQHRALTLQTRIDRIDQDIEGNRIILDYKTGVCSAKDALGERPESPQLPAYLLAEQDVGHEVAGLVYAQVRHDGLSFQGFLREQTTLPQFKTARGQEKTSEHWQHLQQQWRETLDSLADDFMAGQAKVQPKSILSCRYCGFSGLCRIESQERSV
ncbi:MAG: PD-(D/E)XK nuclease family protein [Mariprofundaceae bacterium]|nr:PD-(D/E)XK nuclease family protein [Mariprofundaceae bacterium]